MEVLRVPWREDRRKARETDQSCCASRLRLRRIGVLPLRAISDMLTAYGAERQHAVGATRCRHQVGGFEVWNRALAHAFDLPERRRHVTELVVGPVP